VISFLFSAVKCTSLYHPSNLFLATRYLEICPRLLVTDLRSPRAHGAGTGAVQAAHEDEGVHQRKEADGDSARAAVAAISRAVSAVPCRVVSGGRHAAAKFTNSAAAAAAACSRSDGDPPSSSKVAHADSHHDARTLPAGGTRQHAT
jgi:hypothetical protein